AERNRAGEGEGGDLAGLVAVEGLHHLEGAAPHGVEGLRRRHDLAGREEIDLEPAAGELADAGDELLLELLRRGAAVPERLHPPGDGLLRPRDRGCGEARAGGPGCQGGLECGAARAVRCGHWSPPWFRLWADCRGRSHGPSIACIVVGQPGSEQGTIDGTISSTVPVDRR